MTRAAIVETLAKRFRADNEHVRGVFEMLDAGLSASYIGRFRRAETGEASESLVRRLERARRELEELDRRRATIVRMVEGAGEGRPASAAAAPAPAPADGVAPAAPAAPETAEDAPTEQAPEAAAESAEASPADAPAPKPAPSPEIAKALKAIQRCMDRFELEDLLLPHRRPEPEVQLALDRGLGDLADLLASPGPRPAKEDASDADATPEESAETDAAASPEGEAPEPASSEPATAETPESTVAEVPEKPAEEAAKDATKDTADAGPAADGRSKQGMTPEVARACADYVRPDRGVHTEAEALAGAMRILSDRLGRNPRLRATIRNAMRKHGILTVRASGDESKLGRHRSLLKINEPLRQLQGRRLLAIRQAQKDRAITAAISLPREVALPKVRQALGRSFKPEFEGVIDAVADNALTQRLLPMIEQDVRLELKERGDEEALRFLSQHLRQVLLSPPAGRFSVAGLTINAKQDWILVPLDVEGTPSGPEIKIETRGKELPAIAEELGAGLRGSGVRAIAVGHGKASRAEVTRIRECIRILGADAQVFIVNEAGLSGYANSELARQELGEVSVPGRMAISLGRRYQDPLAEILKVDARHLGLGMEQGLVSKANLRRVLNETVESSLAHVGCDVNTAPLNVLKRVPGLDHDTAKKLVERRAQAPFRVREDLRAEGLLSEAQWTSAVAFLRIPDSPEVLDRTSLHPEQYPIARRVMESTGESLEDVLGKRGATKGLRRADFDVDESTWRDLMREISFPGRDPRPRLYLPRLLPPDTKAGDLTKDQVVEGIISNVASFGAFVDLGIDRDGLIHVSEAAGRYVRDARELLSIGQVIRARVVDASGQRVALSLKKVPERERGGPPRAPRARDGGERSGGGRGRGRGRDGDSWNEPKRANPNVRAAQSRRDGLGGSGGQERGKGRGGGRGGPGNMGGGRPGGGRGGRRDKRDESYDPAAVRAAGKTEVAYNPFASFFGKDKPAEPEANVPQPEAPKKKPKAPKAPKTPEASKEAEAPQDAGTPKAPENQGTPGSGDNGGSGGTPGAMVTEGETPAPEDQPTSSS